MTVPVPPFQDRRASRPEGSPVIGGRRHDDPKRRELVAKTLAALRDDDVKRLAGKSKRMDTARTMLGRLRVH